MKIFETRSRGRLRHVAIVCLLSASTALAVQPQFWKVTTPEDFLAGEIEGMAVTSSGDLRPGPRLTKLASFTDPFVLSQVSDGSGNRYFGTGNEGKVYTIREGAAKVVYTAPEPEIYALAFANGALFVGSSPHGKVYRVDPGTGKATEFFNPQQAYIWAITNLADGSLAVATGVEGKLFKVAPDGKGTVWFDAPESHLRSVASARGKLLVGGSGEGRIYEVTDRGAGRALFDSQFTEISAIYYDAARNVAWATGVATIPPTPPPPPKQDPAKQAPSPAQATATTAGHQTAQPSPSVDISFSFDDAGASSASTGASAELYRIDADGYVEAVRKFDRELVYSITGGKDGAIYLSTGPLGRIYELRGNEIALIATVPEKQVVSFSNDASGTLITTTNSGAVYRLSREPSPLAEYRSAVKDASRFSTFGQFRTEGSNLPRNGITVSFRSGNTNTPDETWSPWVEVAGPSGRVAAPNARYLQWRIRLHEPEPNVLIDALTVAYMNRNAAPIIESITANDPGVVYITGNYPAGPQVLEATNPDEYGIFTGLETPREKNEQGKKLYRKGYRTISWKASDHNGDNLRFAVSFRRKGDRDWLRLRENLEEMQVNFDTSQLPDGVYEIRLVASDVTDNPEAPLTDTREGAEFTVDNSSPTIHIANNGDQVSVVVRDSLSPVGKVEYSIDAQKWTRLLPIDGIADSSEETFTLARRDVENHFVVVRAVDAFSNVATASVRVP